MAVKTPTLSKADPSAAVQVQTDVPSALPGIAKQVTESILQVNKQQKLSDLQRSLEEHRAQFETDVLGPNAVVQTEATKNSIAMFQKESTRLARARASLDPLRFNSESEMLLRKHIANAPGLADEFKAVAKGVLSFDPTGAGLEEAKAMLAAEKTTSSKSFDRYLTLLDKAGGDDIVGLALSGAITQEEAYRLGQPLLGAQAESEQAQRVTSNMKNSEEMASITAFRAAGDIARQETYSFRTNVFNSIPEDVRGNVITELNQLRAGQINKLSGESQLALTEAMNSTIDIAKAKVFSNTRLTEPQRQQVMGMFDVETNAFNALITGEATAQAAEAMENNAKALLNMRVQTTPELAQKLNFFSFASERNLPLDVVTQYSLGLTQIMVDVLGGDSSVEDLRKQVTKEAPVSVADPALLEKMIIDVHNGIATNERPPEGVVEAVQPYIRDMSVNLQNAQHIDDAIGHLNNISAAVYLKALDQMPDSTAVKQAFQEDMSDLGANTLGAIIDPIKKDVLEGKIQVRPTESGVELVPAKAKGDPRQRRVQSQVTRKQRALIAKYNQIGSAYAKITGVPQETFIQESFGRFLADRSELQESLDILTGELAELPEQTGRSRSRGKRKDLEEQIAELQQQLSAIDELGDD